VDDVTGADDATHSEATHRDATREPASRQADDVVNAAAPSAEPADPHGPAAAGPERADAPPGRSAGEPPATAEPVQTAEAPVATAEAEATEPGPTAPDPTAARSTGPEPTGTDAHDGDALGRGPDDDGPAGREARLPAPDALCAAAVDLAYAAAVEEAGDPAAVGEHLGAEAEGDRLVLHRFRCLAGAYRGWIWTVVTTRAPRLRKVTVDDVVLMPGDEALLAPVWVPWSQRLRPGDVGVGDLLPTAADDPRLALRVGDVEEFVDTDAFVELGLGRPRVLSAHGREDASARWYAGEPGPDAHVAKVAPATCLTCGFHVRLAGALGRLFGVCANELAPDDARVTSIDHGCGAHSEALVAPSAHPEPVPFDEDPSDLVPTDVELVGVTANAASADEEHPAVDHVGRPEPYGHA
jgi:hypothetical protein